LLPEVAAEAIATALRQVMQPGVLMRLSQSTPAAAHRSMLLATRSRRCGRVVDPWLLENLVCPIDRQRLMLAGAQLSCAADMLIRSSMTCR
jgi:hypothetical protein